MNMKGLIRILSATCLLWFAGLATVCAQVTPDLALSELERRNISEDTLRARLLAKGIDPDSIQPDQIASFQKVIEETIQEIESDRNTAAEKVQPVETIPTPVEKQMPGNEMPKPPKTASEKPKSGIYGHDMFGENSLFVRLSNTNVKPPDSYVIGEGDKIGIAIYGSSVANFNLEVNQDGFVTPSNMPRILVKGLKLGDAKESMKRVFARYYAFSEGQFESTISYSRNITVNVFGEVQSTGSITVPATNTVFNVLAAAGGPKDVGSVRQIKIISSSGEKVIDVYKFLTDPSNNSTYYLSENDIVFVPTAQKIVQIVGAVIRPMKYELRTGENLKDLIQLSGGLKPNAFQKDVRIVRFVNDQQIVTNINLRDILNGFNDYELYNGDRIEISEIEAPALNVVTIQGAVIKPGEFENKSEMRISSLLAQSELKPTARRDFAYVLRYNTDNSYSYERVNLNDALNQPNGPADVLLRNGDRVIVQDQSVFADERSFQVNGAVRKPGEFNISPTDNLRVFDAILLSGGLQPSAADFGFVIRRQPDEPKTVDYIPISISDIIANPSSSDNISILPNDLIRIADKSTYREEFFVKVSGAVRQPGEYSFDPNLGIIDFLRLAGGLSFSAASNKVDVSRIIFRENEPTRIAEYTVEVDRDLTTVMSDDDFSTLMPFDHIYVREIPDFELQETVVLKGEVKYPGEYSLISGNERLASIVDRAGGLTEEANAEASALFRRQDSVGLVIIHMEKALNNPNSFWNVIIQDGDTVFIPKQEDLVYIDGAINAEELYRADYLRNGNKIAVNFEGEKSALYYINEYGAGVSDKGSRRFITVEQPNGKIEKPSSFLFFRSYPKVQKGATVSVGRKPIKQPKAEGEKEPVEWNSVLRDVVSQATAVLTLVLLLNNINR